MKKAQGLPITTIIIAVLGMGVLIVLFLIFGGKIRFFGGELASCAGKGGECAASCPSGHTSYSGTSCDQLKKSQTCCVPVVPQPSGAPCVNSEGCSSNSCVGYKLLKDVPSKLGTYK